MPRQKTSKLLMMENNSKLRIGTWNLCLGLPNKKDIVMDYLKLNKVNICCLQETEVPLNFPEHVLNTGDYNLELELNDVKKRVGIYILKDIKYKRRSDLEIKNLHIIVCDIIASVTTRIICLYRSFRPPGMQSPDAFFSAQLASITGAINDNCVIMGISTWMLAWLIEMIIITRFQWPVSLILLLPTT